MNKTYMGSNFNDFLAEEAMAVLAAVSRPLPSAS